MAERFAAALLEMGVGPGQRVILYMPNSIQWIVAWLGIQRAGGVCVPITPIYTPTTWPTSPTTARPRPSSARTPISATSSRSCPKPRLKQVIVARMADLLPWWKRLFRLPVRRGSQGKGSRRTTTTHSMGKLLCRTHGQAPCPPSGRDGRSRGGNPLHRRHHQISQRGPHHPRPLSGIRR